VKLDLQELQLKGENREHKEQLGSLGQQDPRVLPEPQGHVVNQERKANLDNQEPQGQGEN
jgi:hypothetical protein